MKQVIHAGSAPEEMPFVPGMAVTGGRTVYRSGATAFPLYHKHPHDEAELRPPESIGAQTRVALDNLRIVLEAAGGKITDIVKVTIFNTEMEHQDEVNRVYQEFFGPHRPARSHVGVNRLVGKGLKIEIEAIAVIDD
jgi:2-iminobutanoate/2-iminopropanoate deaminase